MPFTQPIILGRTGLRVGRMGVAAAYGAPARAFEEAYEHGCTYFYWGSFRRSGMQQAIKNLCAQGKRDSLTIVIQSFSRSATLLEGSLRWALKRLQIDHADILLLGFYNRAVSERILHKAIALKERGLVSFIGVSSHNRAMFQEFASQGLFDVVHVRYNAAHRGAETEVFPGLRALPEADRPGIVTFTATMWGKLLQLRYLPPGESPLLPSDCYRFVMSNPAVDVCMTGPKSLREMREELLALELGPLNQEELQRIHRIGDYVYKHKK